MFSCRVFGHSQHNTFMCTRLWWIGLCISSAFWVNEWYVDCEKATTSYSIYWVYVVAILITFLLSLLESSTDAFGWVFWGRHLVSFSFRVRYFRIEKEREFFSNERWIWKSQVSYSRQIHSGNFIFAHLVFTESSSICIHRQISEHHTWTEYAVYDFGGSNNGYLFSYIVVVVNAMWNDCYPQNSLTYPDAMSAYLWWFGMFKSHIITNIKEVI